MRRLVEDMSCGRGIASYRDSRGLPANTELYNQRWLDVRAWIDDYDSNNAWPRTIAYRNLRHHAATKWFPDELGEPWEVVAQYLGDKLTTVLNTSKPAKMPCAT